MRSQPLSSSRAGCHRPRGTLSWWLSGAAAAAIPSPVLGIAPGHWVAPNKRPTGLASTPALEVGDNIGSQAVWKLLSSHAVVRKAAEYAFLTHACGSLA
ncbi:hypothetical protein MRX96_055975 [Rhipicephalus microplus]